MRKNGDTMSKIMDELIYNEKKAIALRLLKIGKLLNEEIAESLDLSIEMVNELEEKNEEVL